MTTDYLLAAIAMTALGSSVAASTLLVDYPVLTGQALRHGLAAVILRRASGEMVNVVMPAR